jgi:hypothetical protein
MSYRKFGKNDVLINTLKAHPRSEFYIYSSSVYYNNRSRNQGQYNGEARMIPDGFVSLYEYNIDKGTVVGGGRGDPGNLFGGPGTNAYIEPYISKDSTRISLSMTTASLTSEEWGTRFDYGDKITGSYPQYASIKREFITTPSASSTACKNGTIDCAHNYSYMSLRPLLNHYGTLSEHFKVTSSFGDKDNQELNLIHIPSIFYGNKIKPGTVSLRWYVTGTLIAEVADSRLNGELIQTSNGRHSAGQLGSVQGVVFYNEGFVLLTGSVPITEAHELGLRVDPVLADTDKNPRWIYWGAGARDGVTDKTVLPTYRYASFGLSFEGETTTETMTLYARAHRGEVNYSNNPSFVKYNQRLLEFTSSHVYEENNERLLKNIVTSSFADHTADFRRQVYVSKIGVYDEEKNLIGIATLADPVLKDEDEDYVFKIKIDM